MTRLRLAIPLLALLMAAISIIPTTSAQIRREAPDLPMLYAYATWDGSKYGLSWDAAHETLPAPTSPTSAPSASSSQASDLGLAAQPARPPSVLMETEPIEATTYLNAS